MIQSDPCRNYQPRPDTSELVRQTFADAGAFETPAFGEPPFQFAAGSEATLKINAEHVLELTYRRRLLGLYAIHPCLIRAKAIVGVPNGMTTFAQELSRWTQRPLIQLVRPDGAGRYEYELSGQSLEEVRNLLETGSNGRCDSHVCIVEDVSTTGSSAYHVAQMLREFRPGLRAHTLSMWERGVINQKYTTGDDAVVYHTFVQQPVPADVDEFRRQFPDLLVSEVSTAA